MSVVSNNILAGASGQGGAGYAIERSLRFNSGDSSFLSRTPSAAGNRKTWTWSGWVKRSALGSQYDFASAGDSGNYVRIAGFNSSDKLELRTDSAAVHVVTEQVFRDCSAWYHIVIAFDTTQSTASNRTKFYVNGSQVTSLSTTTYPGQNTEHAVNNTGEHRVGAFVDKTSATVFYPFNGYVADVHFIDGQALAPTDFGETDDNGVWQPKEFTGQYNVSQSGGSSSAPTSTSDVAPSGSYGNGIASAALLFGASELTNGQNHIRQDNGGIEWSPAIALTGSDVAGAKCLYFNSASSSYAIEFKINGSWVTAQANAQNSIGTSSALITLATTGDWTGVRVTGGGNTHVTTVAGIFVNGTRLQSAYSIPAVNGFHLDFKDNSSNAALGTDTSGVSPANTWTVNNLTASSAGFSQYIAQGTTSGSFHQYGPVTNLFDGSPSTGAFSSSGTSTFTFGGSAIVASTSIKIRAFKGDASGANVLVNGTDVSSLLNAQSGGGYSTVDVTSTLGGAPITLANVSMVNAGGGSGNIAQIFVDDVELITGNLSDNDSLVDTPTNGTQTDTGAGNQITGNYATLNPLKKANITTSNGNLDFTHSGSTGSWQAVFSTIGMSSGKYYCEFTCKDSDSVIGIAKDSHTIANDKYVGNDPNGWGYNGQNGSKTNNSSGSSYGNSYTSGDVIGIAFDADGGNLYFYKNGAVQNSGTAAYTGLTDGPYFFAFSLRDTGNTPSVNFGQRGFAYQNAGTNRPSADYKALCTANLPEPTIADGSKYFDTLLWTGDGSTTRAISGLEFSPDLCWTKARSIGFGHRLWDTVRGATKRLESHATTAEATEANGVKSFDSNGFTIGNDGNVNQSGYTFASWNWDAGTSTVTNNDGSIASQVRAQPSAGFSIVTFTQGGSSGQTPLVGHGLNAAPEMILVKSRSNTQDWRVYHSANGVNKTMSLNGTGAAVTPTSPPVWSVSSSTFGAKNGQIVDSGFTYVAYCFAPVNSYSAMGSYEGLGTAGGAFVYLGFRPALLIVKDVDGTWDWYMYDTARNTYNVVNNVLRPSGTNVEEGSATNNTFDFLSNGFKVRGATSQSEPTNYSGHTYIYYAVAENPFQANGGLAR